MQQYNGKSAILCSLSALFFLSFIVLASQALAQGTASHKALDGVALVIGNSAYQSAGALANPANDATAIAEKLQGLGFRLHTAVDQPGDVLKETIDAFARDLSSADVIFVFYAGHGMQIDGRNFIAPVDLARTGGPKQLIAVDTILSTIEVHAKPDAAKIIVLDACRDNPFSELGHGGETSRGLARIELPKPAVTGSAGGYFRVVAFATAAGQVASDGNGQHSPYTESLLRFIDQPGLEVSEMFRMAAGDVLASTGGMQKPEYLVQTSRTLFFRPPNITECDRLAVDARNFIGMKGISFEDIDAIKAVPACLEAVATEPASARLTHNLARSLEKAERLSEALEQYQAAADKGHPAAINALGIMYLAGCGMAKPDVGKALQLISRARDLGDLEAGATLTSHDLLPFLSDDGKTALADALSNAGISARPDALGAAVSAFQEQERLKIGGLTLETVHALKIYETVPAGFRCH
ncbi:caspase family protein (plasmid) [Rhizobium sp. 32-5/1]|uniref:caspase family protein n=1 Tax=Rhizobium sp. 32-5/1 TaxID=3019602 RepID=UPI00240CF4F8|nr:caspase family protein [Rhizobium sp. 32-5/1]WEZ85651.1 caspase family protein [Rhizobium sp. 32-5/1]